MVLSHFTHFIYWNWLCYYSRMFSLDFTFWLFEDTFPQVSLTLGCSTFQWNCLRTWRRLLSKSCRRYWLFLELVLIVLPPDSLLILCLCLSSTSTPWSCCRCRGSYPGLRERRVPPEEAEGGAEAEAEAVVAEVRTVMCAGMGIVKFNDTITLIDAAYWSGTISVLIDCKNK